MKGDISILHPAVRNALESLPLEGEILPCRPEWADTAEFCAHYGVPPEQAVNAIVLAVKTEPRRHVACLVRADTKLDVNRKIAALLGTKKISFAPADETAQITGMAIGGVTVIGLPAGMQLLIDDAVMQQSEIVIGGGNRESKIRIAPSELTRLPDARVASIAVPR